MASRSWSSGSFKKEPRFGPCKRSGLRIAPQPAGHRPRADAPLTADYGVVREFKPQREVHSS
jgi:hypothetical protein